MSTSTWNNITTGLHAAVYDSYTAKSSRQRAKREEVDVMADVNGFCQRKRHELEGVLTFRNAAATRRTATVTITFRHLPTGWD